MLLNFCYPEAFKQLTMTHLTHRQLFLEHLAQTSENPLGLEITHANGIYLYDINGKAFIDSISGISVSCLGHGNQAVIKAVQDQASKYMHTIVYGEYILSPQIKLAKLLADVLPGSLSCSYFVNSGTEATEGAMKLAKRYTGRQEIIACKNAYHGSTQGSASLMSSEWLTQSFRPLLPGITHIEFNNFDDIDSITDKTACVIIEPIQAESGIYNPKDGYLPALRSRCNETGTLLIFDEIQTGYGKTGYLFAFQKYNVIPDILMIGKAMGGGMPIAAFISSNEILSVLKHNPVLGHITTFGGHPVNCAAALATLETLISSGVINQVNTKEKIFLEMLVHPAIKEVRSAGLMIAVDLDSNELVQKVIKTCLEKGLITDWFLFNDRSLRICPPLIITEVEINQLCKIVSEAISENA